MPIQMYLKKKASVDGNGWWAVDDGGSQVSVPFPAVEGSVRKENIGHSTDGEW